MTRKEAQMIAEELARVLKPTQPEEFLSHKELAKWLGVSESWVRHHSDEFPCIRIGNHTRYVKSKVTEMLLR